MTATMWQQVYKIATHPNATAAAIESPKVADLPRPRDAVIATVEHNVCADIASTTLSSALA